MYLCFSLDSNSISFLHLSFKSGIAFFASSAAALLVLITTAGIQLSISSWHMYDLHAAEGTLACSAWREQHLLQDICLSSDFIYLHPVMQSQEHLLGRDTSKEIWESVLCLGPDSSAAATLILTTSFRSRCTFADHTHMTVAEIGSRVRGIQEGGRNAQYRGL